MKGRNENGGCGDIIIFPVGDGADRGDSGGGYSKGGEKKKNWFKKGKYTFRQECGHELVFFPSANANKKSRARGSYGERGVRKRKSL